MTDKRKDEMKLKLCPFCGSAPEFDEIYIEPDMEARAVQHAIGCSNSECIIYCLTDKFDRRSDAAKAWNTRAALSAPRDDVAEAVKMVNEYIEETFVTESPDHPHVIEQYLKTLIRAASTPSAVAPYMPTSEEFMQYLSVLWKEYAECADDNLSLDGQKLKKALIKICTPSAEVEYWKDKCYTAESDAEIHAQCHDKVFDEKKALEAEVQALRDIHTLKGHISVIRALAIDGSKPSPHIAEEAQKCLEILNQTHTKPGDKL